MFSIISTGKAGTYGLLGEDILAEDLRLAEEEDFLLGDKDLRLLEEEEDLRLPEEEEDLRLPDEEEDLRLPEEDLRLREEEEDVSVFPIFPDSFTHLPDAGLQISSLLHVFLHGLDIY